jgi:hypothetical protein
MCASPSNNESREVGVNSGSDSTSAVSSGRQIPTSEHRGHFGLSTSGLGILPASASDLASSTAAASVSETSVSSMVTRTRWRVAW